MRQRVASLALLLLALAAPAAAVTDGPVAGAAPALVPPGSVAPAASAALSGSTAQAADTVPIIVLVRHAEKADDDPEDPSLTEEGRRRAGALAALLGRSDVSAVLSTDYRRTRETAAPLARAAGVEVELYDPTRLEEVAEALRRRRGVVVVVGHSNTTPELVSHLGGDAAGGIADDEYDRLYVLHPGEDGGAATLVLRYGG